MLTTIYLHLGRRTGGQQRKKMSIECETDVKGRKRDSQSTEKTHRFFAFWRQHPLSLSLDYVYIYWLTRITRILLFVLVRVRR